MNSSKLFEFKNKIDIKKEILAGFTVAMTMIPESLSFAILAGLSPLVGLYGAFIMGIITALLGGRPGMVSGGAGATVITLIDLYNTHGEEYIFASVAFAGMLQIFVGIFRMGGFIRLIPQSVMYGFLNGLAIVIFMSQLDQFKIKSNGLSEWISSYSLYTMFALTLLTIFIVNLFSKISKAIPASLVAIFIVFLIVLCFKIETKTVGDIASIEGGLPSFHIPKIPVNMESLKIILPYSIIMASVGLIETLLTLKLVDEITETKGKSNKECLAQGVGNFMNGFFGGMGGCAMIAQTFVSLNAGSRSRIAPIIGALTILFIILIGSPVIERIPMAALVGVMMMIAITTFKWDFFRKITKMPKSDIIISILVTVIIVLLHNLALAVFVGVIISAIVFSWDSAREFTIKKSINEDGYNLYEVSGSLFFCSTTTFLEKFDVNKDSEEIIIDFKKSRVVDMSAINALSTVIFKYSQQNKKVIIRNLNKQSKNLLNNAKILIEVNLEVSN